MDAKGITKMSEVDSITPSQLMISSCTGALLTSFFVTPLDVVKIRLQAQQKEFMRNKCFLYCNGLMDHLCLCSNGNSNGKLKHYNHKGQLATYHCGPFTALTDKWYRRPGHFNGTFDAFIKIARNEGMTSLWSGLPPTLIMAIPSTVVYFTIYDQLRENLTRKLNSRSIWIPIFSGGVARTISVTVISPLELIRTKMQSKKLSYFEIGTAVKSLVKTRGIFSIWHGIGPTLLRDVPFSCLYWANYEFLKKTFNQIEPSFAFSFFAGATAGSVSAVLTLPFDVVKTYKQIELGEKEMENNVNQKESNNRTTKDVLKRIYRENGVRGLFSGIVPRVIKVAPACAIMISTYEFSKAFFKQYNASKRNK